jgi:3-methyladenine DNA glycosylase AlkD
MNPLAREILARAATVPQNVPGLRAVRREYSRKLRRARGEDVLALGIQLVDRQRLIATELVASHREAVGLVGEAALLSLAGTLDSWDDVDIFSVLLAGPAWRAGRIGDEVIAGWARSKDRWWRRAALASTIKSKDAQRVLAVCRMLIADRDDMVVKAMSWALRELSKHHRRAVEDFLERHRAALAARVVPEVTTKLTTGRKHG